MDLPLKAPASELLQAAYRHGIRHDGTRQEKKYGVRYSEIIRLVGFEHAASNPVDPMHNSFLGIVKAFVHTLTHGKKVLRKGREIDRFVDVLTKAVMPGHLGRIPESVGERYKGPKKTRGLPIPLQAEAEDGKGGMVLKAEHWKRILQMLPVALYYAWRSIGSDGLIEDDRELGRWYRVAVDISIGVRTLHARRIAYDEAVVGVTRLARAAKAFRALGGNLTTNWHIAMHYPSCVHTLHLAFMFVG